jgi:hypothetical protein
MTTTRTTTITTTITTPQQQEQQQQQERRQLQQQLQRHNNINNNNSNENNDIYNNNNCNATGREGNGYNVELINNIYKLGYIPDDFRKSILCLYQKSTELKNGVIAEQLH